MPTLYSTNQVVTLSKIGCVAVMDQHPLCVWAEVEKDNPLHGQVLSQKYFIRKTGYIETKVNLQQNRVKCTLQRVWTK